MVRAAALSVVFAGLLFGAAALADDSEPELCLDPQAAAAALQRLNAVRAAGAPCDAGSLAPLVPDVRLEASARAQAADLANRDTLSHEDIRQRALMPRLQSVGYSMTLAGENLAAGQPDFDAALAAWLASPGHCRNVMQPAFVQVGLACVQRAGTRYGRFWVAHFGAPQRR